LDIYYNIIVKDRYYFIIVEGQILINISNNVILTVSVSSGYVPMMAQQIQMNE